MKLRPSVSELIAHVELPKMIRVKQLFPRPRIETEDIANAVFAQIEEKALAERVKPGMRIAITVGSRGIANVHVITKAIVDFCKARGGHSPLSFLLWAATAAQLPRASVRSWKATAARKNIWAVPSCPPWKP